MPETTDREIAKAILNRVDVERAVSDLIGISNILCQKAERGNDPEDLSFLFLGNALYDHVKKLDAAFCDGLFTGTKAQEA